MQVAYYPAVVGNSAVDIVEVETAETEIAAFAVVVEIAASVVATVAAFVVFATLQATAVASPSSDQDLPWTNQASEP